MARNVRRPHTLELLGLMAEDVIELHGDRLFGDDAALVGGFATLAGQRLVFLGHQKGGEVEENIRRNFGMPHPDGYRKAMRIMRPGRAAGTAHRDLRGHARRVARCRFGGAWSG